MCNVQAAVRRKVHHVKDVQLVLGMDMCGRRELSKQQQEAGCIKTKTWSKKGSPARYVLLKAAVKRRDHCVKDVQHERGLYVAGGS